MFFFASKVLGFFAQSSNLIFVIGALGVVAVLLSRPRAGIGLMATSIVLLGICGLSPLGDALLLPLSERFAPWQANGRVPAGIIVLGGAINPDISAARGSAELNAAAERLSVVAQLAKTYPQAKIVFSGGNNRLRGHGAREADIAGTLLESFGIARERLVLEDASRTTSENARQSKARLNPGPGEVWLLVTSAFHMPRAIGVFRASGFDVEAYPVDFRTRGWSDAWRPFHRVSDGLHRLDTALHEWAGLVAYRLTGRTSVLFPGPLNRAAAGRSDKRP